MTLTRKQVEAIAGRLFARTTAVEVSRVPQSSDVEVTQFEGTRLIETARVRPGGSVRVLP